jgi:hypothetical protein
MRQFANQNTLNAIILSGDVLVLGVSSPGFAVFVVIYDIIFPGER